MVAAGTDVGWPVYAKAHPDASFTDWLRVNAQPDWTAAVEHRFVRELADDTIEAAVYRRYLVQDLIFLEALVGLLGHAIGQAPGMDAKLPLARFLSVITSDENDYFERAFDALDVTPADRAGAEPNQVTRAFQDLFDEAATTGGFAETLAVLVPVEWVYETWATRAADAGSEPERWWLREWTDLHANDGFRGTVSWLRGQLDRLGPQLDDDRRARVADLFAEAVRLEVAFFDATYEPNGDGAGTTNGTGGA